jgi:protein gp37
MKKCLTPGERIFFELIAATPYLDWLILTKRPEKIAGFLTQSLPDQCQEAGIAFFMKQMAACKKNDADIPSDLFIRQFPIPPHDPTPPTARRFSGRREIKILRE